MHIGKQDNDSVGIHDPALFYLYSLNILTEGSCIFDKILSFSYQRLQEFCQRSRQVICHRPCVVHDQLERCTLFVDF